MGGCGLIQCGAAALWGQPRSALHHEEKEEKEIVIMKLLTADIRKKLLRNGQLRQQQQEDKPEPDFWPVVKLFTPDAGCTWLLTEIDPEDPDIAFGLCDLGMGYPELGSVSLSELESVRGKLDLPVERDLYFTKTLSAYADEAVTHGAIKA
jgi:hypothetical protein